MSFIFHHMSSFSIHSSTLVIDVIVFSQNDSFIISCTDAISPKKKVSQKKLRAARSKRE
jgi:hypothetical protein